MDLGKKVYRSTAIRTIKIMAIIIIVVFGHDVVPGGVALDVGS